MYKIYIDEKSYSYLQEWTKTLKRYVVNCPAVARKFQVFLKFDNRYSDITLYVESTKYGYKYRLKSSDETLAKGKILISQSEDSDFDVLYNLNADGIIRYNNSLQEPDNCSEIVSQLPDLISLYCDAFLLSNAFLMYGNVVNDKEIVAMGRNSGEDKIIVFRPFKGELYAVPTSYHRSPEGIFPVRGHFRQYKSGKVVWIDSYMKGADKE